MVGPTNDASRVRPVGPTAPLGPAPKPAAGPTPPPGGPAIRDRQLVGPADLEARAAANVAAFQGPITAVVPEIAPPFQYRPIPIDDLRPALVEGGPITGVQANDRIVEAYAHFSDSFRDYLGGEPPVGSWPTNGKFAARQAGVFIQTAENTLRLGRETVEAFTVAPTMDDSLFGMVKALWNMAPKSVQEAVSSVDKFKKALSAGLDGMREAIEKQEGFSPLGFFQDFIGIISEKTTSLRAGLVGANVGIYQDFAPAFDCFLRAESAGEDGVAAFKAGVAEGRFNDPSGLLTEALGAYQEARQLYLESQLDPKQAPELLARREALVGRANLLIGVHEQFHVVQPSFEDPELKELMARQGQGVQYADGHGAYPLLPNGGNWADFATRMGLEEIPPPRNFTSSADLSRDVFRVVGEDGQPRFFKLKDEITGTIGDYMLKTVAGEWAADNLEKAPPELPQ